MSTTETQLIIDNELHQFNLNELHIKIMKHLDDDGPKTVNQILERFSEFPSRNVKYALRRLREWGIIRRSPNLLDMRRAIFSFNGRFVL